MGVAFLVFWSAQFLSIISHSGSGLSLSSNIWIF